MSADSVYEYCEEDIMEQLSAPAALNHKPKDQVSGPAIGLLVTGIIGAVFSLVGFIALSLGTGLRHDWVETFPEYFTRFYERSFALGSSFVEILVAAFIIYAALKMRELQQWGLAVAASILAMLPCISPCCIIGLPVGIWSLVVLMRAEVKGAFT
jgi:hypothetical protein